MIKVDFEATSHITDFKNIRDDIARALTKAPREKFVLKLSLNATYANKSEAIGYS